VQENPFFQILSVDYDLKDFIAAVISLLPLSGRSLGVKFQQIFTDNCNREMKVAKLSCQTSSFTRQDYYDPAFLVQRW
jgi:hypothetical protein